MGRQAPRKGGREHVILEHKLLSIGPVIGDLPRVVKTHDIWGCIRRTKSAYFAAQPRERDSAVAIKPSILPPLMSAVLAVELCDPPLLISAGSWYGLSQPPVRGLGTQTVNSPSSVRGKPSAPG